MPRPRMTPETLDQPVEVKGLLPRWLAYPVGQMLDTLFHWSEKQRTLDPDQLDHVAVMLAYSGVADMVNQDAADFAEGTYRVCAASVGATRRCDLSKGWEQNELTMVVAVRRRAGIIAAANLFRRHVQDLESTIGPTQDSEAAAEYGRDWFRQLLREVNRGGDLARYAPSAEEMGPSPD